MYEGNETFFGNGLSSEVILTDFWRWAYGDFLNNIHRAVLAEFIVAIGLGITKNPGEEVRKQWRPYDLLTQEGWRVEVKCASYVQSWECRHPDHVSYRIAPSRMPAETGDIRDEDPQQWNCDVYVFVLYKAESPEEDPLNLDLWEFRILKTATLNAERPNQKTITLPSLQSLDPIVCDFSGLKDGLRRTMA